MLIMNPRVKQVLPYSNYTLTITFDNDEKKLFDVKPYLNKGFFKGLKSKEMFNSVKPFLGSIQMQGGQDFCPDTLYMQSKTI